MKYRTGFVSNSSSSSFVVGFSKIPRSPAEMEDMLFPDGEEYSGQYKNNEFATTVFDDCKGKLPLTLDEIVEVFCSGYIINMDDWDAKHRKEYDAMFNNSGGIMKYYEMKRKEEKKRATALAKKWTSENKGLLFFEFNYGDESGSYYSQMEHNGLFNHLPHKCISQH